MAVASSARAHTNAARHLTQHQTVALLETGATEKLCPSRTVSTGAALSFIVSLHVCPGGTDELCETASLMLGAPITPEHLRRSRITWAQLRVVACQWWPRLAHETGAGLNRDNWRGWLARREARYGATQPVPAR